MTPMSLSWVIIASSELSIIHMYWDCFSLCALSCICQHLSSFTTFLPTHLSEIFLQFLSFGIWLPGIPVEIEGGIHGVILAVPRLQGRKESISFSCDAGFCWLPRGARNIFPFLFLHVRVFVFLFVWLVGCFFVCFPSFSEALGVGCSQCWGIWLGCTTAPTETKI